MPFAMTQKILDAYYPPEEFRLMIIYGPLGYGKSAYSFKVGVEVLQHVYHLTEEQAWEKLKQFIVFHPMQFFQRIEEIDLSVKRVPFIIWEDMGLWLNALKWNDPFVKAFLEYLSVARTHLASLVGSTPSPELIIRRLRRFPNAYTVRIYKEEADRDYTHEKAWRRTAKGFLFWIHPDMRHSGVRTIWVDRYTCKLPDSFYTWYKPLRDTYEDMALRITKERWKEVAEKTRALLLQDYPYLLSLPSISPQ